MLSQLSYSVNRRIVEFCTNQCRADQGKIILNRPLGNFFYDCWAIKDEYLGTPWEELLNTLPFKIGEARVIKLAPGETYMSHADIDDRWHLNLTGEQSYLIDLNDQKMYQLKSDRYWYHMDAGKLHVAANFGSIDRFQIVIRHLLNHSTKSDLLDMFITPSRPQHDYRYKFDKIISPFLNRQNKLGNLKDFKFEQDTVMFKISRPEIEKLNDIITDDFKITYA